VTKKGQTRDPLRLERNISETAGEILATIVNY